MAYKYHIAGMGAAGSCTTLLNLIMDGLPQVFAMGDTHSVINYKGQNEDGAMMGAFCGECGPDGNCPIFTPDFMRECKKSQRNLYQRIGARSGKPIIYTQDAPGRVYNKRGLPDVVLILYRDIYAWTAAYTLWFVGGRRFTEEIDVAIPVPGLDHYCHAVSTWIKWYKAAINWLRRHRIGYITLNMDGFRKRPTYKLRMLCNNLKISYDGQSLRWWENEHHRLGGRYNASRGKQSRFGHKIAYDEAWKRYMLPEQKTYIDKQSYRWKPIWNFLIARGI